MTVASATVLSGIPLDTFLDETEEAIDLQSQAGVADDLSRPALAAALRRQPCRADSMNAVARLFRLWLRAGEWQEAQRVLVQDGADVLAQLPHNEQHEARISLAFWHVEALQAGPDAEALHRAVGAAEQVLQALAPGQVPDQAWAHLAGLAAEAGDHRCARRCAEARHALQVALPQRSRYRAWDDALLSVRLGLSYAADAQPERAHAAAQEAIRSLAEAGPDQDVDADDWLRLGDSLVRLAPDCVDTIVQQVLAALPPGLAQPRRRSVQVRLARLQARALCAQGRLEEGLAVAAQGRHDLSEDEDDDFNAQVFQWLLQAGHRQAAARLAFECMFHERGSSRRMHPFVVEQVAAASATDEGADVHWALALASAAVRESTQWVCGDEAPSVYFERHLALAARWDAAHPAIELLQGLHLLATGHGPAAALPLLESAVPKDPEFADSDVAGKLWLCRMQVHGAPVALTLPFIEVPCGGWCYSLAVRLEDLHESLPDGAEWPEDAVGALQARYYRQGLARFEAFFESGQGYYLDGNAHTYSMLCNNLAIYCRYDEDDPASAVALHHKGIAASPFAEHYDGLVACHWQAGDKPAFVDTADQLWHYAATYGYGRHTPTRYVPDVANTLYQLDRDNEIAIWLQRIEEWWSGQDEEEQAELHDVYLETVVILLANMAYSQPEDTLARLEPLLPRLRSARLLVAMRNAGVALERAGLHQRALAQYEDTLTLCAPPQEDADAQRQTTLASIEVCKQAMRAGRPWWRFWG